MGSTYVETSFHVVPLSSEISSTAPSAYAIPAPGIVAISKVYWCLKAMVNGSVALTLRLGDTMSSSPVDASASPCHMWFIASPWRDQALVGESGTFVNSHTGGSVLSASSVFDVCLVS